MTLKVFISHSNKDMDIVKKLESKLKQEKFEVFIAEEIEQPGKPLSEKIKELIRKSNHVVVLYTKNAEESKWVHEEIGYALGVYKPLIPIVEKGVLLDAMLKGLEYVPFEKENPDKAITSAIGYLKKLHEKKLHEERPAIVELIQFFIVPLKKWFFDQMNKDTTRFISFDIGNSQVFYKNSNLRNTHVSLDLERLYKDFNSLLERLHLKSKWDEEVEKYNKLTHTIYEKISELESNVRKLLDEIQEDIRIIYDKKIIKRPSIVEVEILGVKITRVVKILQFDTFMDRLAKKFYQEYRKNLGGSIRSSIKLSVPWAYVGNEIFLQVAFHTKSILEEIEKLKEERKHVLKELISILEQLQEQLREEYNLTLSE
jgi:hypothetical protein